MFDVEFFLKWKHKSYSDYDYPFGNFKLLFVRCSKVEFIDTKSLPSSSQTCWRY